MEKNTIDLKTYFETLLIEKDKRYEQKFNDTRTAVDAALIAADKAVAAALAGQKEAVIKAENANEKRFEGVNEFRMQLRDQQSTFLSRTEYVSAHDNLAEKIGVLSSRIDKTEGTGLGMKNLWGIIIGAVGITSTIILLILRLISI